MSTAPTPAGPHAHQARAPQALARIRVVEFAGFAAGPGVTKHLADHGAEVIHVESHTRPDGFRTNYPPYKDNKPGLNRSGLFALCNNNKLGITLNLKAPQGVEIARRLVARADIVLENFTPGTMKRLGLDYDTLRQVKPDLIMISTCNQGQTGPLAHHPGFGTHLSSLGGFTNLIGYPDGPPMILYGPYIDFIAVNYGVIALLAALDYRRRTGRGQYIDLAQLEAGIHFVAPALLEFAANGRVAHRVGNRHRSAAPHGAYRCRGDDRWVALSVFGDDEWQRLCQVAGHPEWAADPRFATILARKAHEEELDRLIAEWTAAMTAEAVMQRLQAAGVRAGVVKNMRDICEDPQLAHRGVWVEVEHPELGRHFAEAPPWILSRTPGEVRAHRPQAQGELMFSDETLAKIREGVARAPDRRTGLYVTLRTIQEELGFVPPESILLVAEWTKSPPGEVLFAATFLGRFDQDPRGRHLVATCSGMFCYLRGGGDVARRLEEALQVEDGGTSPDGKVTYMKQNCLGGCETGPTLLVDGKYHQGMTPQKVDALLTSLSE
ncbi:MAG: CoA transferase [Deltaproteobacteria bacterium]|nr:CoA transferase [Deltaproteobacteria bacterium]